MGADPVSVHIYGSRSGGEILPSDPAVFWEGFCPNCHVPLAGDARNFCPDCLAYWNHTEEKAP
jgi:hypothetical protein